MIVASVVSAGSGQIEFTAIHNGQYLAIGYRRPDNSLGASRILKPVMAIMLGRSMTQGEPDTCQFVEPLESRGVLGYSATTRVFTFLNRTGQPLGSVAINPNRAVKLGDWLLQRFAHALESRYA